MHQWLFEKMESIGIFCQKGFYEKYWARYNALRENTKQANGMTLWVYRFVLGILKCLMFIPLIIIAPALFIAMCVCGILFFIVSMLGGLVLSPVELYKAYAQASENFDSTWPFSVDKVTLKSFIPAEYLGWLFAKCCDMYKKLLEEPGLALVWGLVWLFIPITVVTGVILLLELIVRGLLYVILFIPAIIESIINLFRNKV